MSPRRYFIVPLITLVTCLLLTACGGGSDEKVVNIGGATVAPTTVERPWGTVKTFPKLKKAESPSSADVRFASDMAMHHQQAIELSDILLGHEKADERIAASARFIKQDQSREIGVMQAWLEAWGESSGADSHGDHGMSSMPGMVAQEKVDEFAAMDWKNGQIEFLRLMVEHHQGAVDMSKDYLADAENSFTRSIAQHIIREQMVEISYMNNIVKELAAG
ncbi:DUF305 domain-containing protein [Aeromicrobium sp. P5_D10]